MNPTRLQSVARRLKAVQPDRSGPPLSDAEFLTRFLDRHDEAAFEALVARHLPGVRAVCRSLLRDPNDVDDAVQATFLILVRRAAGVRNRLALGGWLCRVAWRTANRLREANARRQQRHDADHDPDTAATPEAPPAVEADVAAALGEEVRRLPEPYRLAVLLCYAAGTPTAEAAARLGWPKGTLLTRLAWARKRLRDRLTQRGVTLAGGLASALAARTGSAGAGSLAARIRGSAVALMAGAPSAKEWTSERVQTLTEGMVRTMIGTKLKAAVGIGFLAVALLGLGLGRMTVGTADAAGPGGKKSSPATGSPPPAASQDPQEESRRLDAVPAKAEAAPDGPGADLVVRRPLGSYTREVPAFGKATLTFTENRLHVVADVRIDKGKAFTVTADADYSINRESMVYGIITAADVASSLDTSEALEISLIAGHMNDIPFAFRVRAEEDAIAIKDIKFGAIGSPLLAEMFGVKEGDKEIVMLTGIICGRYKFDPNPDRNLPPPAPRPAAGDLRPKPSRQPESTTSPPLRGNAVAPPGPRPARTTPAPLPPQANR